MANPTSKSTARRRECWRSFTETLSLKIHQPSFPTFHHNNGTSESTIDFFVTSSNINTSTLRSPQYILTQNNFSDFHFSLLSLYTVPVVISWQLHDDKDRQRLVSFAMTLQLMPVWIIRLLRTFRNWKPSYTSLSQVLTYSRPQINLWEARLLLPFKDLNNNILLANSTSTTM